MSKVHIRDFLAVNKADMQAGKISTVTLCGMDDPNMNQLAYGDPVAVMNNQVKNACERCRNIWASEENGSKQKAAINRFRKLVQSVNNFRKFR